MKLQTPNIKHLRAFLQVVDTKSISAAAEYIYLSQPALSQAIAKLETQLNTKLFKRRSDGMYVTESGSVYAHRVRKALSLILIGTKETIRIGSHKTASSKHSLQLITKSQIFAIIAVNETQNFSLAARNLGVSQSSLHRSARDLESLLGVELFRKTSSGIKTSKAAKAFAKAAQLAFAEIAQGTEEVNSIHKRDVGRIVVGCMPLARTSILPKAINKFTKSFPEFSFQIKDGSYKDLLHRLIHGELDLLIGALREPNPSFEIAQDPLIQSSTCIVAKPCHFLFNEPEISLQLLAECMWVVPPKNTPTHQIYESIFSQKSNQNSGTPKNIVETSSQILLTNLLLTSDRIGIISEEQIQHELDSKTLKKIPFHITQKPREIGISYRNIWEPTKTQRHFLNCLNKFEKL